MKQEIQKPVNMLKDEFITNVVDLINSSGLPYVFLEYVIKDIYNEIHNAAQQQARLEKEEYEKELKNAQAKDND